MNKNILNKNDLIYKNRIDPIIGLEYIDFYENKYNTEFFINLYIEHKKSWNQLIEGNCIGKKMHLERFKNIIDGIKKEKTNTKSVQVIF